MLSREILICPECIQADAGSISRHRGELRTGDEAAAPPQRDQLPDTVTVPGNGEGLPVLDRVHDLA